eukprot:TsM_000342000 transcript=TsM_000342000 gene=TsM_000342000
MTSDYPCCCSHLRSQTLFNMLDTSTCTSLTEPFIDAFKFPTSRVAGSNNDTRANESSATDNGANFSSVPDEVNDKGVNKEERKILQCPECKKICDSSASLQIHKQSHARSWECYFCDKAFSRKWIITHGQKGRRSSCLSA